MKLTISLRTFLLAEKASVRLFNMLARWPGRDQMTLSQFIDAWPLERLRKEVFGFGKKAQAELLDILTRHNSCKTGRRFADYCARLRPPQPDRTCIYCGCTDSRACAGGCFWIVTFQFGNVGVCSNCLAPHQPFAAAMKQLRKSK